jgi:hypothetical protein
VRLVPILNNGELTSMKLLIIKDLEKTLRMVYEHQYRNILSKIVSNKKKFVKKQLSIDVSEDINKYNSLTVGLTNYLVNLFDVFGESAVLNAKKTFEENGYKWGKKLRKKLLIQADDNDMTYLIKCLYINVSEIDYMEMSNGSLIWHFSKLSRNSINEGFMQFHPRFYSIKAAWLHSFIMSFTSQYTSVFEKKSEDDNEIITSIELKEDR